MAITNTYDSYGTVTKTFHWLIALLILTAIPLGFIGSDLAHEVRAAGGTADPSLIATTKTVFSLHKTIGVLAFWVAVLRIIWAISQPKPGLINGDNRLEAFAAEFIHYLLYGSMILVPLSGWIHHAATSGFAPIWWPFGQNLPGIPKSQSIAQTAGAIHDMGKNILIFAILAHVAGALKHVFIDHDSTLRRMLPGSNAATPSSKQPGHTLPALLAAAILGIFLGGTALIGESEGHSHGPDHSHETSHTHEAEHNHDASKATAPGNWQVENGDLTLDIIQMGNTVSGRFTDWQADITYAPGPDGKRGAISVTIPITSLQLGSVTEQAMGTDYFDAHNFPQATVNADLIQSGDTLTAQGNLTIKDHSVPINLPVDLTITDTTATAKGQLTINRMDFDIGTSTTDQNTLANAVTVTFNLTAKQITH